MSKETRFVAVSYDTLARAEEALATVEGLDPVDAAIVVRDPGGRVQLHQTRDTSAGEGAVAGGTAGLLAGLLLAVPVAGALAGLAAVGVLAARDTGIPDERLRALGRELEADQAVLCVLVEPAALAALTSALAPLGGVALP